MKHATKTPRPAGITLRVIPAFGLLGTLLFSGTTFGQAVSNPNQISGAVGFTNKNPVILDILGDEGFNYLYIRADSNDVTPALNNYAYLSATGAASTDYQLTVESSQAGISYRLSGDIRLDSHGDRYIFDPVNTSGVFPEPSPDTPANIQQCASMLDINFVDTAGNEVALQGGNIKAYKETSYGTGTYYRLQAQDFAIKNGSIREFLAVHGDDSNYRVDIIMESGSDPNSNLIRGLCRKQVTPSCDEVVPITCVIGGSMELGAITGTVDMLGESELDIKHLTRMRAFNGPLENYRYDHVAGSGDYLLDNLVPSDVETPSKNYMMYGEMAFRTGYRTQYLRTPWLFGSNNPGARVEPGKTTDLGNTFVMDPGYISGLVLLSGPPVSEGQSFLEDLHRDADDDYDQDGIPDNIHIYGSSVSAHGMNVVAEGATMSSHGGLARTGFEGSYDPEIASFAGNYQMALGGLNGEPSVWRPNQLVMQFSNYQTQQGPEEYQHSRLYVTNNNVSNHVVSPGSNQRLDHTYCMNQVTLNYKSLAGTFYNPNARANGKFEGADFLGNNANYSVYLNYAYGTPRSPSTAANQGMVVMALPQGSYDVTPMVTSVNPNSTITYTELPPVAFNVACRQEVQLTTDLQLSTDELPIMTEQDKVTVSGSVNSLGNVEVIKYSHNNKPAVVICNNCGKSPSYSLEVSLEEGNNEIVVTAQDEYGDVSTSSSHVSYEPVIEIEPVAPLKLVGCSNKAVTVASHESGANVEFSVTAEGGCGTPTVSCDAQSGSFFGLGSSNVSCSTADSCSTQLQCQFNINVEAEAAEEEEEADSCNGSSDKALSLSQSVNTDMLWPPNHKFADIGLKVSVDDPCTEAGETSKATVVTEVWSDETEIPVTGDGSGNFAPDAKQQDGLVSLRSERRGTEDGRVYLLITRTTGQNQETAFACSTVVVPHSRRKASIQAVQAQAQAARDYCEANGGSVPSGYTQHGISKELPAAGGASKEAAAATPKEAKAAAKKAAAAKRAAARKAAAAKRAVAKKAAADKKAAANKAAAAKRVAAKRYSNAKKTAAKRAAGRKAAAKRRGAAKKA